MRGWKAIRIRSRENRTPGAFCTPLFNVAIPWEMLERNPTDLIRQWSKRLKTPRVLPPTEFKALLAELAEPYKAMVRTAARLGLRPCEVVALQRADVNFRNCTVTIEREFIRGENL